MSAGSESVKEHDNFKPSSNKEMDLKQ